MGQHFYKQNKDGTWKLSKSVDTIAKARKSPHTYAKSVTTMIGDMSPPLCVVTDEGYTNYSDYHIWRLGKEGVSYKDAQVHKWGLRKCPETGDLIPSSDWGTRLHEHLEAINYLWQDTGAAIGTGNPYEEWTDLWADWLHKNDVEVIEAELMIGCTERKLAGMLDFVGKKDGKVFLADYKSRAAEEGKLKTKAYDKDAQQLAIEARMVREQWNLDYEPRIYTVLFNTEKPEMHVHLWTEKAQEKHLDKAERLNQAWNLIEQL